MADPITANGTYALTIAGVTPSNINGTYLLHKVSNSRFDATTASPQLSVFLSGSVWYLGVATVADNYEPNYPTMYEMADSPGVDGGDMTAEFGFAEDGTSGWPAEIALRWQSPLQREVREILENLIADWFCTDGESDTYAALVEADPALSMETVVASANALAPEVFSEATTAPDFLQRWFGFLYPIFNNIRGDDLQDIRLKIYRQVALTVDEQRRWLAHLDSMTNGDATVIFPEADRADWILNGLRLASELRRSQAAPSLVTGTAVYRDGKRFGEFGSLSVTGRMNHVTPNVEINRSPDITFERDVVRSINISDAEIMRQNIQDRITFFYTTCRLRRWRDSRFGDADGFELWEVDYNSCFTNLTGVAANRTAEASGGRLNHLQLDRVTIAFDRGPNRVVPVPELEGIDISLFKDSRPNATGAGVAVRPFATQRFRTDGEDTERNGVVTPSTYPSSAGVTIPVLGQTVFRYRRGDAGEVLRVRVRTRVFHAFDPEFDTVPTFYGASMNLRFRRLGRDDAMAEALESE